MIQGVYSEKAEEIKKEKMGCMRLYHTERVCGL
jgi:hypothetical protein